jgi:uncharacterized protein with NAD-binding domain and iron-sulfur cluster
MTRACPRRRRRVAILGGGMAGLATAWRLSEPGWRDRFDSITVYQRGWRLGGKGASSRGVHGRIEEHGLHIWLGYYENAFRLLRELYDELDRTTTDPTAPIRTWREAIVPAPVVGLGERHGDGWDHWVGHFAPNPELPGEPGTTGGTMSVAELVRRSLRLLHDFADSLPPGGGFGPPPSGTRPDGPGCAAATRSSAAGLRRSWHLLSVVGATLRGIVADGLLTDPRGFRKIDGEDYRAWIGRHGATPDTLDSTLVRGLYDLVFAHQDADPRRGSFGAGWGVFLSGKTFFDYKGAIFWKMTAGMGDVVFAPLYQALRRRGVDVAFFHRVDQLHLSPDRLTVDGVSVGVQARLAPELARYQPLVRVRGLPCFPAVPLVDQLAEAEGIEGQPLESHGCRWPDAATRVLRRGEDYDVLVLAIPVGMARHVCRELIDHSPEWRDMVGGLRTVATQALQLWLREDEPRLGWPLPGSTMTGYAKPFDTWASMPQVIPAEDWPPEERPGTVAYFCGTLDDRPPADHHSERHDPHQQVRANALRFLSDGLAHLLPGAVRDGRFRWDLLCGAGSGGGSGGDGAAGPEALDSQFWVANTDPSDRYVQSIAGTDHLRLRPDESGYDDLFLAGDWTDCGLNAGCIEAAVLSGLQAANAVLGRSRQHRIAGHYLL